MTRELDRIWPCIKLRERIPDEALAFISSTRGLGHEGMLPQIRAVDEHRIGRAVIVGSAVILGSNFPPKKDVPEAREDEVTARSGLYAFNPEILCERAHSGERLASEVCTAKRLKIFHSSPRRGTRFSAFFSTVVKMAMLLRSSRQRRIASSLAHRACNFHTAFLLSRGHSFSPLR